MKSKKDEGNDFFKKENYQSAIDCYAEYVKSDHPDNSKAYANMALSFFKLKKYENCVNACESAVELEPENQKAQFRMYEAYKELQNNYGMLIAAERFCKLSKDEKEISPIQKTLPKIKEQLSFALPKNHARSQSDKIMLQILNEFKESNEVPKAKKQPLMCLESKWFKIEQLAKENPRLALNQAKKFFIHECKTQQEKDKFMKLTPKLSIITSRNQPTNRSDQTSDKSESSEEDIKLQELQKYTVEQAKKIKQVQTNSEITNQIPQAKQQTQENPNNSKMQTKIIQPNQIQKKNELPQITKVQEVKDPEPAVGKWEDFVKPEQAQKLFEAHIKTKMALVDDQFVGLYESLSNLLRSPELDRFQKEAVLSVMPTKLKKFNMFMKSYTGQQKQQLSQLFTQNNFQNLMEKYFLKK